MRLFLKLASLTIATIGLLISLADAVGWIPNPRAQLADQITSLGSDVLSLNTENVDSLLIYFLKKKYPAYQKQSNEMAGIAIEDLRMNASVMGTVYIEHKNGGRHQLCSFQELREWANNEKFPFWIGWWVAVAGLVCAWAIELLDVHIARKARISATSESGDVSQEDAEVNKECKKQELSNQSIESTA